MAFILAKHYKHDGDKMAVAETITVPKVVAPRVYLTPEKLAEIRAKLSQKMREFWSSPEGQLLRIELSNQAYASGWVDALEGFWTEDKKNMLRDLAKTVKLGARYKFAWGKPAPELHE